MISIQEYLDAGSSEPQARLLFARDRRVDDQFANLTEQMSRGFADTLTTTQTGFGDMNRRFDAIEAHLRTISPN